MPDFLLELRSEEIPARMQARAREDLARLFAEEIAKSGLKAEGLDTYATPRRLALIARGLADATQAVSEELKGPRASAPPQALDGFLRKTGLAREQLAERDGVLFAVIDKPGRATAQVLAEAVPAIVRAFPWPKSMRWGKASVATTSLRWVRPLQGIVALFGDQLVPFAIDGIDSDVATLGHRFHHPGAITLGGAHDYVEKLRACHVIVDQDERAAIIRDGARALAAEAGLTLIEDEALVEENAGLTEWPVPLLGRFDGAFLDVPPEVIRLTMRTNQKYFACAAPHPGASRLSLSPEGEGGMLPSPSGERIDSRSERREGPLANAFICTANIAATDSGAAIVEGNRKVLAARLADARFFWEQDLKASLEEQAAKLSQIVFHEKLGTVADKVERVAKLARWLVEEGIVLPGTGRGTSEAGGGGSAPGAAPGSAPPPSASPPPPRAGEQLADLAERAARLCKADLVTGLVGEFPELQGVIGGHLAAAQGEDPRVAAAIRDHYKPVGQGDDVPTDPVTVAVSLADKLDTLVGFFAVYERPTGSRDPYALRRATLGIVELLLESGSRLNLRLAVAEAYRLLVAQLVGQQLVTDWDVEDDAHHRATMRNLYIFQGRLAVLSERPIDWQPLDDGGESYPASQGIEHLLRFVIDGLASVVETTCDYVFDRLEERQRKTGQRYDLLRAVLPRIEEKFGAFVFEGVEFERGAVRFHNWAIDDDLVRLLARVKALQAFVGTADGANLLAAYKRAANILKKEGWSSDHDPVTPDLIRGPASSSGAPPEVKLDPGSVAGVTSDDLASAEEKPVSYTPLAEEHALIAALDSSAPRAAQAVADEDFAGAMHALSTLRAPIDAFFDKVTVNDPDPAKRAARLALLTRFRDACHAVADFSKIEG